MNLKKYFSLLHVFLASIIGFVIHKIAFILFIPKDFENDFVYSIPILYLFFTIFSLITIFILIKVKEKNIDIVGNSYLLLSFAKILIAYPFLRPILNTTLSQTPTEKISFFAIFIYFLTLETIITIRLLNNKE